MNQCHLVNLGQKNFFVKYKSDSLNRQIGETDVGTFIKDGFVDILQHGKQTDLHLLKK